MTREEIRGRVSRRYSGSAHLAFTLATSLGVTIAFCAGLSHVRAVELLSVPLFFVFCFASRFSAVSASIIGSTIEPSS